MARGTPLIAVAIAAAACARGKSHDAVAAGIGGSATENQAVVTAKNGKVELLRGADGSISEAKVGDKLSARDALRTEVGEADVAVEGVRLRVHEDTQLTLKELHHQQMRAKVRGSVESDVEEKANLDVEADSSDAIAHSEGGHFFVTADGHGVVAVASVTGSVHLSAGGKSVDVNKGEVSRLNKVATTPSQPAAALRRVLLSVQWPNQRETNKATLPIVGKVEPGSRVFVQGEPVVVEAGGNFHAQVPLRQGRQKIAVVTVDALGRRKQVENVVLRDDSLPDVKVKKKLWQWH